MKDSLAMLLKTNGGKMSIYRSLAMLMKRHKIHTLSRDRYDNKEVRFTRWAPQLPVEFRARGDANSASCEKTSRAIIRNPFAVILRYTNRPVLQNNGAHIHFFV
jgi:hypothetical protein